MISVFLRTAAFLVIRYTEKQMQDSHYDRDSSDSQERELLTVEQAAQFLQLSPSSIRSYIREGKLPAFRIAGLRKVLIARSALLALLEPAREEPAREEPARAEWNKTVAAASPVA